MSLSSVLNAKEAKRANWCPPSANPSVALSSATNEEETLEEILASGPIKQNANANRKMKSAVTLPTKSLSFLVKLQGIQPTTS